MTLKYIYIVLILIVCYNSLYSQTKEDILIASRENKLIEEISQNIITSKTNDEINEIVKYYKFKSLDKGLKFIEKILSNRNILSNDSISIKTFSLLANLYISSNQIELAARNLFRAYNISMKNPETLSNAWILLEIGNLFFSIGAFDKSTEYYRKANEVFNKILSKANEKEIENIYLGIAVSYENMGLSLLQEKKFDEALIKVRDAYNYRKKLNSAMYYQYANMNIANVFLEINNIDSAIFYNRVSLDYSTKNDRYEDKTQQISFKIRALNGMYRAYYLMGDKDSADFYQKELLNYANETDNIRQLTISYVGNASFFNGVKNFKESISQGMKAIDIANKYKLDFILNDVYRILYQSYNEMGDIDSAFKYLQLTHNNFELNRNKANRQSIELSQTNENLERNLYEIEKINNKNRINNTKIKNQRNVLIAAIIFLTLIGIGLYNRFHFKNKMVKQIGKKNDELQEAIEKLNKYQLELNYTNNELKESNETKNKLFSIIAHDLKNSIGSVRDAINLLNSEYHQLSDEEKIEFLDLSKKSSDNLYFLLENLLLWSSAQKESIKINKTEVLLYFIVNQSIQLFESRAQEKNIKLINNIDKKIQLNIDANLIDTVIRNLLNNAVKFTNENGEIKIYSFHQDNQEFIVIEDNGIGMPPEKADNLFKGNENKSTYGTSGEKGTGLGLLICKEFITMHNGKIWAESEEGNGTKIIFTLPN